MHWTPERNMDSAALVLMGKLPSQVAAGSLGDVWPPQSTHLHLGAALAP